MIFEYIIVEYPSKKEADKGTLEKVIKGPKILVAADIDRAKTQALLEYGMEVEAVLPDIKIEAIVRPFK